MSKERQIVLMIHGINSGGSWYRDVRMALEPHFRCLPLRYRHFRYLGWLTVNSHWLRRRAVRTVARRFDKKTGGLAADRPHVIAHSFGSWITAHLMKIPFKRMHRVIFLGSPLPCDFNWEEELAQNLGAFEELTNERGLQDRVLDLIRRTRRLHRHFGEAGSRGFTGPEHLVHDTGMLRVSCPKCRELPEQQKARIHNVSWRDFGHCDCFVGNSHATNYWLPHLWGYPPEEYYEFCKICLEIATLERLANSEALADKEREFSAKEWHWTQMAGAPSSMSECVKRHVAAQLKYRRLTMDEHTVEEIRDTALRFVWVHVSQAMGEYRKLFKKRRERVVLWMHPITAIGSAVREVLTRNPSLPRRPSTRRRTSGRTSRFR
jgi:hypothetical protein